MLVTPFEEAAFPIVTIGVPIIPHILIAPGGVADLYGLIARHSHWLYNRCPGIPATADEAMLPFLAESRVGVSSIPRGVSAPLSSFPGFRKVFLKLPRYS